MDSIEPGKTYSWIVPKSGSVVTLRAVRGGGGGGGQGPNAGKTIMITLRGSGLGSGGGGGGAACVKRAGP